MMCRLLQTKVSNHSSLRKNWAYFRGEFYRPKVSRDFRTTRAALSQRDSNQARVSDPRIALNTSPLGGLFEGDCGSRCPSFEPGLCFTVCDRLSLVRKKKEYQS